MKPLAGAEVSDFGTRFGFEAAGSKSSERCSKNRWWTRLRVQRLLVLQRDSCPHWLRSPKSNLDKARPPQVQVHETGGVFLSARPFNRYIGHRRCSMADWASDS